MILINFSFLFLLSLSFLKGYDQSPVHCNDVTTFRCNDGSCIAKACKCDSNRDCEGGEDEENCGCQPPDLPHLSYIINDRGWYTVRERFHLECKETYILVGKDVIKCKLDQTWTRTNAVCEEETICACHGLPDGVSIANEPNRFPAGITLDLYCRPGFVPAHHDTITCDEDGQWSESPTRCDVCDDRFCDAPHPSHGAVLVDDPEYYVAGTKIQFACIEDLTLVGCSETVCKQNHQWSDCVYSCKSSICQLDKYLMPDELFVKGFHSESLYNERFDIDREVTLTCNGNLVPIQYYQEFYATPTAVCHLGGRWSPQIDSFHCVAACYLPWEPTNGHWVQEPEKNRFISSEKIPYRCNYGYKYGQNIHYVECEESGHWKVPENACIEKAHPCMAPLINDFVVIHDESELYLIGVTISLECTGDHVISGCSKLTCQSDGEWSECEHKCLANACRLDAYFLPEGIRVEGYSNLELYSKKFSLDEVVTLTCKNNGSPIFVGQESVHNHDIRCAIEGKWLPGVDQFVCDIDDCLPNPCMNDGFCRDFVNAFECECVPGYTGETCENEEAICASPGLPDHALIVGDADEYIVGTGIIISCEDGYELVGDNEMHCVGGGEWTVTTATCIDLNDCSPNPCLNGGVCRDEVNNFQCECAPGGYSGKTCEIIMKEAICACPGLPEHAFIVNDTNVYKVGTEIKISCEDRYELVGDSTMRCVGTGEWAVNNAICEEINHCVPNPCEHVARCENMIDDFFCVCIRGYEGKRCTKEIDECRSDPCKNGGTCNDEINNYTCSCNTGFTGDNCETNIDDCLPNPCHNEYTSACKDGVNEFFCKCVPGFTGKTCDRDDNECRREPCENGGICNNMIGDFICECDPGYTGKLCETIDPSENSCPVPTLASGMTFSPEQIHYQSAINLHCKAGSSLIGNSRVQCTAGGTWENTTAHCVENFCALDPYSLGTGVQVNTYTDAQLENEQFAESHSLVLSCEVGKQLYANDGKDLVSKNYMITCQKDKLWSINPESFECKNVCAIPTNVENIEWQNPREWYGIGETLWYLCKSGYLHTGDTAEVHCNRDGQWSDFSDLCIKTEYPVQNIDLVFLLDGSGSVGKENFKVVKTWVNNISDVFDLKTFAKLGVVQYSYFQKDLPLDEQKQIHTEIDLGQITERSEFKEKVDGIDLFGSQTFTAHAINKTVYDFESSPRFDDEHTKKVLLLLTDGKSSDHDALPASADYVRSLGIDTYAVGVGPKYVKEELQIIANGQVGNNDRVYDAASFDDLNTLIEDITHDVTGTIGKSTDCTLLVSSLDDGLKIDEASPDDDEKIQMPLHSSITFTCPGTQKPFLQQHQYVWPTISCQNDRKWSNDPADFVCKTTCGPPPHMENGVWNNAYPKEFYEVDERSWFSCNAEFEHTGSDSTSTCLSSGEWSAASCRPSKK